LTHRGDARGARRYPARRRARARVYDFDETPA